MADVTLPQLGETVTEGTITQWFKQVGDTVAADEPLFEVSTDKVDTEVPSPVAGVLTEIRVPEGDTVDVGTVIAVVGDGDARRAAAADARPPPTRRPGGPARPRRRRRAGASRAGAEPPPRPSPRPPRQPAPPRRARTGRRARRRRPLPRRPRRGGGGDNRLLSPVVRRLVNEHGLDPDAITGTGPGGRITRDDVLDHIDAHRRHARRRRAGRPPRPPAAGRRRRPPCRDPPRRAGRRRTGARRTAAPTRRRRASATRSVPLSKIRTLTGDHMVMSKATSPHAFSVVEVDFANVDVVRNDGEGEWKATEGSASRTCRSSAGRSSTASREFPHLNASVGERDLIVHNFIDLGIAVDLDYEGLLAPVIRDAETKRLAAPSPARSPISPTGPAPAS